MIHTPMITGSANAARTESRPAVGPRIGPWQAMRLLGEGQWSRVYQARPTDAARDQPALYAVKVLQPKWESDPRVLELLCREARVGSKVSHQHLVPILAANIHEPPYYLVMPLLEGQSLASYLRRTALPPVSVALWIARQAAEALEALHAAEWLHGDVKPSNLLIAPGGHVTLIDLGFAARSKQNHSLADRPLVGTLHYIAPELLISRHPADIRSDVYSLGVTLFEMLSGQRPFQAEDAGQLAAQHRQDLPADLRAIAPHLLPRVAGLVRQMLAKEPLRRPMPQELIDRLAALEIATFDERRSV
jgi:serine/threonine-protein kinase